MPAALYATRCGLGPVGIGGPRYIAAGRAPGRLRHGPREADVLSASEENSSRISARPARVSLTASIIASPQVEGVGITAALPRKPRRPPRLARPAKRRRRGEKILHGCGLMLAPILSVGSVGKGELVADKSTPREAQRGGPSRAVAVVIMAFHSCRFCVPHCEHTTVPYAVKWAE
jgi:hypothetical protein